MLKSVFVLTMLWVLAACTSTSTPSYALTLSDNGKALYSIVVPEDATPAEKKASTELKKYLDQITGGDFQILNAADAKEGGHYIFTGPTAQAKAATKKVKIGLEGLDGILIKTEGENLIIAGDRPRGTLYAVYSFLEDYVGCRWWSSDESTIPNKPTLTLDTIDDEYIPPILIRDELYRDVYRSKEFQVQMKLNGQYNNNEEEYGWTIKFIPDIAHTFFRLLPPDTYFEKHPDWYSMIDGKRVRDQQLCCTNPEMRKEMAKVVIDLLDKEPSPRMVSVSQMDSFVGNCQCDACKAIDTREGSPAGSLLDFINYVAAEVEKKYPNVLVETLAYNYSRPVPKTIKPRKNVIIRLVGGVGCTYEQPLNSPVNKQFRDLTMQWSGISENLFIWDYVTNFSNYLVPHPNLQVLGPNIRFFARNHAKGVFEHGDSGSLSGDFVRLRVWLLSHLMWKPYSDADQLMQEFMTGYYGPAAPFLTDYLNLVKTSFLRKNIRLSSSGSNIGYLSIEEMNQATTLFNNAEKAVANDPALLRRVQRDRLTFDHLWLVRYAMLKKLADIKKVEFLGPKDPQAAMKAFVEGMDRGEDEKGRSHFGTGGMYSEGANFNVYMPRLQRIIDSINVKAEAPKECQGLDPDDWVDLQDCYFNLPGGQIVEDTQASDKSAAQAFGAWGIQLPISGDFVQYWGGDWELYVSVRVDGEKKGDVAFEYGLYDYTNADGSIIRVRFDQIPDNQYHTYKLGKVKLNYNKAIWISKDGAEGVYVDRVFMIRRK